MMRDLTKLMAPTRFEDVSAVLALGRPGPMEANSHINYALPQERPAEDRAPSTPSWSRPWSRSSARPTTWWSTRSRSWPSPSSSLGTPSAARTSCAARWGRRRKRRWTSIWAVFSSGMKKTATPPRPIKAIWDVLMPFSAYGFNKSHTAGYGVVSYWTAYLKANYPAEYMAALLTSVGANKDKMAVYLAESSRMGVKMLPDVNQSQLRFAAVGDDIRFGRRRHPQRRRERRRRDRPYARREDRYTSFNDFLRVCRSRSATSGSWSLIKAGAFDSLGHHRKGLLMVHEQAIDTVIDIKRNEAIGRGLSVRAPSKMPATPPTTTFDVPIPARQNGTRRPSSGSNGKCSASTSPATRSTGPSRILERSRDHSIVELLDGAAGNRTIRIAGIITSVDRKSPSKATCGR